MSEIDNQSFGAAGSQAQNDLHDLRATTHPFVGSSGRPMGCRRMPRACGRPGQSALCREGRQDHARAIWSPRAPASSPTPSLTAQTSADMRSSEATNAKVNHVRSLSAIATKAPPTRNVTIDAIKALPAVTNRRWSSGARSWRNPRRPSDARGPDVRSHGARVSDGFHARRQLFRGAGGQQPAVP